MKSHKPFARSFLSARIVVFSLLSFIVVMACTAFLTYQFTLKALENRFLFILGLSVLVFTLGIYAYSLYHWLQNKILTPLLELKNQMLEVENGQWHNQIQLREHKEWNDLFEIFNRMMVRVKEINDRKKNIETRLIKTEESLKYKNELEHKNQIIEKMNLELTQSFHNVALLYTVSQYLSSSLDVDELLTNVQHIFEEKFICQQYALAIALDNEKLKIVHSKGLQSDIKDYESISFGQGILGSVAKTQKTTVIENMQKSEHTKHGFENEIYGSFFCTPLSVRNKTLGVLAVARNAHDAFSMSDQQSLEAIASQIAISYDRCSLYTQTKELSVRDELTHLFNRRYFQNVLQSEFKRAVRYNRPLSLLMIDVDHFKQFNDTFGHLKGDLALKTIAKVLLKNIREVDILARYGGEEFVLLLPNTDIHNAYTVAEKLRQKVETEMRIDIFKNTTFNRTTTISLGLSSYPFTASLDELIHSADMALYEAKKKGRNCSVVASEVNSDLFNQNLTRKDGTDF